MKMFHELNSESHYTWCIKCSVGAVTFSQSTYLTANKYF